jgi:hypothetical protein
MTDPFEPVGSRYHYNHSARILMVCKDCGALISDTVAHDRWHTELEDADEIVIQGELIEKWND